MAEMVQVARNHHFVAQCYLAGFTDTGTKDGRLCVFDFKANRFFRQKPRNVAFAPDFNRVDLEGHAPDVLETAFGELEGRAASVIRRITAENDIPEDEEFSYVLNLITLFAVRNPAMRQSMTRARRHMCRVIGSMLASDRRLYDSELKSARKNGFVSGKDVPYEQVRDFLLKDQYTIEIQPQDHLTTEMAVFKELLPQVCSRNWSLLIAAPDAPEFITCDHPVSLVYKQLVFPLGTKHALMGNREQDSPRVMKLRPQGVAEINARLLKLADRQIYSRTPDITLLNNQNALILVHLSDLSKQAAGQGQSGSPAEPARG